MTPDTEFALGLARLTLRLSRGLVEPDDALAGLRQDLADLDVSSDAVLERAQRLETAPPCTDGERAAFEAWFGSDAASRVLLTEDLDLGAFVSTWGADRARLLFDRMLDLFGHDDRISTQERACLSRIAHQTGIDDTLLTALLQDEGDSARAMSLPLSENRLRVGRAPTCDLVLPDLQVALHHAELVRDAGSWRVVGCGSHFVVHEQRAVHSAPFPPGKPVRIGPYVLVHDGEVVEATSARRFNDLVVSDLSCTVGARVLLHPLSLVAFTGEVVAVIGPSGSGKSTLLSLLSGAVRPESGTVAFRGRPLDDLLDEAPGLAGVVPQDDIVLGELTVAESLRAAARLRLPSGATRAEVDEAVARVLEELEMDGAADQRIGTRLRRGISGGQRKRVNFGQVLVGERNRLLFFDEPTSGLDPRAAQGIAHLARQLADRDRLVFLVTHDLTPRVMSQVDHLLVLTRGGRLAWFGPVEESLEWFGVDTPDAIFDRLEADEPEETEQRWLASPAAHRWVETRAALVGRVQRPLVSPDRPPRKRIRRWLRNLVTLVQRFVRVRARDPMGLAVTALQPLLLAAVMVMVFPTVTVDLLLMLTLSSLWFGMSAGVRELLVDRALWRQERRVGVDAATWLASKVLVLGPLVVLQSGLLVVLTAMGLSGSPGHFPSHGFHVAELAFVCGVTGLSGLSIGLLVSALATSSAAAVGALVLMLVPQITFSGVVVPLEHGGRPPASAEVQRSTMGDLATALAGVTHQRYALDAALQTGREVSYMGVSNTYRRAPLHGARFNLGFIRDSADPGWTLRSALGWLLGVSLAKLVAALGVLWLRNRR